MAQPRLYSVDEANDRLPQVRRLVERIVSVLPELPELSETVRIKELMFRRDDAGETEREELAQAVADLRSAELSVATALRELESMDVTLKDPNSGLVDFYGERDGEMIELCWRLGEDNVSNWHRIGEGFPGRKPL
jgi:hypothetical protein